ncbi:hypothetical protein CONCODRAFT_71744 [Conidiobolus coronatus NRRL 28638]|uniref:K Homology domain-containing protein n=1 Tax=Conidiobolus coronatus (strain ATCC 28846 / CBS 209.66 / NRRL 28638) TaxID=796925 RepID=A0A137P200_CONC2|nr:hypothetical protein CONCODRAFT_71744 [Conidiobolus coronatus NRRL 28638]|eukprot:KXN69090.1 hypothetical protein CONCODRAFT_71744 [Conidiobolus coronatus NRRL 28638]
MGEDYSAVPPPAAAGSANISKGDSSKKSNPDFSDALAKAKALAAKFATQATQAPDQNSDDDGKRKRNFEDGSDLVASNQDYGGEYKRFSGNEGPKRSGMGNEDVRGSSAGGPPSLSFQVPSNKVGLIIGRNGETLKRIQNEHGVKILFNPESHPPQPERTCILNGHPTATEPAKKAILDLITASNNYQQNQRSDNYNNNNGVEGPVPYGMIRIQVPIPISKVGLVIGRGGETIRELQTRSGCKVMVLPEEDTVKQERFVQIQGPQQAVDIAKGMVTDVVNNVYYQAQSVNAYGQPVATLNVSCTLTIPNNTVGLVIGRGGETIKNLQQVSRAKIQIEQNSPEDAPEDRLIHLSGSLDCVEYAKTMINDKVGANRVRSTPLAGPNGQPLDQSQLYSYGTYGGQDPYYNAYQYSQYAGYYGDQSQSSYGYYGADGTGQADDKDKNGSKGDSASAAVGGESGAASAAGQDDPEYQAQLANYYAQYGDYYKKYYESYGYGYNGQDGGQSTGEAGGDEYSHHHATDSKYKDHHEYDTTSGGYGADK